MKQTSSLLDLLLEAQNLDRLPRTGYAMRGVTDPESISEHCWQLSFLVWTLAAEIDGLDAGRALELALIHDLGEVRIGDLPRSFAHYFPPGTKNAAESAAAEDLLAPVGKRGQEAFAEFQAGDTPEARLVKACDRLQLLIKVESYARQGNGDLSDFDRAREVFDDGGFEAVRRLYETLVERHRAEK